MCVSISRCDVWSGESEKMEFFFLRERCVVSQYPSSIEQGKTCGLRLDYLARVASVCKKEYCCLTAMEISVKLKQLSPFSMR